MNDLVFDAEQDWADVLWENNSGSPSLAAAFQTDYAILDGDQRLRSR